MSSRSTLDLSGWPAFDAGALPKSQREVFLIRRTAIELYACGETVSAIEARTGLHRRQLYRLLDRCQAPHDDGRPFGWRAVVPYAHVSNYERTAGTSRSAVPTKSNGSRGGAAGAFTQLLRAYPTLARWIEHSVQAKRITIRQTGTGDGLGLRLGGLKALHADFLRQCRSLGLGPTDYPLNTEQLGIRSLAATVRAQALRSFGRGARLAGATHLKGLPFKSDAPTATQYLDVVEFDGHRLDLRLKIVVRDPLGFEQAFEIERIWLLVVIDVCTRAVLGYHLSLNREYTRYDVIRTIEAALEPHRTPSFTLPGLTFGPGGGFPSSRLPELGYATWQWFKLDNARANLADDVRHALADFIGCHMDAGPAYAVNEPRP